MIYHRPVNDDLDPLQNPQFLNSEPTQKQDVNDSRNDANSFSLNLYGAKGSSNNNQRRRAQLLKEKYQGSFQRSTSTGNPPKNVITTPKRQRSNLQSIELSSSNKKKYGQRGLRKGGFQKQAKNSRHGGLGPRNPQFFA